MSYREADAAIISIAQHARPNPIGQMDDSRAQLSTRSMLVVMKLSSKRWSIRPMVVVRVFPNERRPLLGCFVEREDRVDRARRHARTAIDALVGMNIKHLGRRVRRFVFPGVNAVHRADIHARGILGTDAWLANDICHCVYSSSGMQPHPDRALHAGAARGGSVRGLRHGGADRGPRQPA